MGVRKMKVIVIMAHPCSTGHNRTILKHVEKILKSKGVEYELIDLYKDGFDPVMKECEHLMKDRESMPDVLKYQKLVKENNRFIFISPIWWNSVPAGLKGFFERVFSTGFAYKYVKILNYFRGPKPLLKGKKAAVFLTSGSPLWVHRIIQGNRAAKVICKDTLRFCGIKGRVFQHGNSYKVNPVVEKKLEKLAVKGTNWILK